MKFPVRPKIRFRMKNYQITHMRHCRDRIPQKSISGQPISSLVAHNRFPKQTRVCRTPTIWHCRKPTFFRRQISAARQNWNFPFRIWVNIISLPIILAGDCRGFRHASWRWPGDVWMDWRICHIAEHTLPNPIIWTCSKCWIAVKLELGPAGSILSGSLIGTGYRRLRSEF